MKWISFLLLLLYVLPLQGQMDAFIDFQNQVKNLGLAFAIPTENQYETISGASDFISSDFAIEKQKGDLEVRFILISSDEIQIPHINTMGLISTLATNQQETVISIIPMGKNAKENEYGADWGLQAFFTPKTSFSEKQHCKLLALYKEGKAMAYLLYLFDKPNEELEHQQFLLRFE